MCKAASPNLLPDLTTTIRFPYPNSLSPLSANPRCLTVSQRRNFRLSLLLSTYVHQNPPPNVPPSSSYSSFELPRALVQLSASSLFLLSIGFFAFSATATAKTATVPRGGGVYSVASSPGVLIEEHDLVKNDFENVEEDKEMNEAFEKWKSKTFALTVPLRIAALRGSVPPSWIKDFVQSQGKRLKLGFEVRGGLEEIFSELSLPVRKGIVDPKSAIAADLVTIGDSWLNLAICNGLIEPLQNAEDMSWFGGLTDIWKVYLRRNSEGELDPKGKIWGVPYRWGSMVIMYKKSKFDKYGLPPIQDWADLWRPELAGRISMVYSAREIVGAVFKYMGLSYNTNNIDTEVPGGITSVQQNLALLQKQVRLFDSKHYLKAFAVGDVWVAVGWSSDILPAAKRMSNVAVIVPKSGASLWADVWVIPATTRCTTSKVGGRIRGPSPLIHQWLDFCLQPVRELPFQRGVVPGASPSSLERMPTDVPTELVKGAPKLETNLVAGVPPPEILARCEFLEPLSEAMLSDYQTLISSMQKPGRGLIQRMRQSISTVAQTTWTKLSSTK
ncbi:hypothetical protein Ancab_015819 [Ancistrocladus abbreviatus]